MANFCTIVLSFKIYLHYVWTTNVNHHRVANYVAFATLRSQFLNHATRVTESSNRAVDHLDQVFIDQKDNNVCFFFVSLWVINVYDKMVYFVKICDWIILDKVVVSVVYVHTYIIAYANFGYIDVFVY